MHKYALTCFLPLCFFLLFSVAFCPLGLFDSVNLSRTILHDSWLQSWVLPLIFYCTFLDFRIQPFGIFIDFSVICCQLPASLVVYSRFLAYICIVYWVIKLLRFQIHFWLVISILYSRTCLRWSLSAVFTRNLCRLLMFSTVIASRNMSFMRIASVPCLHCCVTRTVLMIRSFFVRPFLVFSPRDTPLKRTLRISHDPILTETKTARNSKNDPDRSGVSFLRFSRK